MSNYDFYLEILLFNLNTHRRQNIAVLAFMEERNGVFPRIFVNSSFLIFTHNKTLSYRYVPIRKRVKFLAPLSQRMLLDLMQIYRIIDWGSNDVLNLNFQHNLV